MVVKVILKELKTEFKDNNRLVTVQAYVDYNFRKIPYFKYTDFVKGVNIMTTKSCISSICDVITIRSSPDFWTEEAIIARLWPFVEKMERKCKLGLLK